MDSNQGNTTPQIQSAVNSKKKKILLNSRGNKDERKTELRNPLRLIQNIQKEAAEDLVKIGSARSNLGKLLIDIHSNSRLKQYIITRIVSTLLFSERIDRIAAINESIVLPRLIEFAQRDYDLPLQELAISAINKISSRETRRLVKEGIIRICIHLVHSKLISIAECAVMTLGNIVQGNERDCEMVVRMGGLEALFEALSRNSADAAFKKGVILSLGNFFNKYEQLPPNYDKILPTFCYLYKTESDPQTLGVILWSLTALTRNQRMIAEIVARGVLPKLLHDLSLGMISLSQFITPSIKLLITIMKEGDQESKNALLELKDLVPRIIQMWKCIRSIFEHGDFYYLLCRIIEANSLHIETIMEDAGLLRILLENARYSEEEGLLDLIMSLLRNGSKKQIEKMLELGLLKLFRNSLQQGKNFCSSDEAIKIMINAGWAQSAETGNIENRILQDLQSDGSLEFLKNTFGEEYLEEILQPNVKLSS